MRVVDKLKQITTDLGFELLNGSPLVTSRFTNDTFDKGSDKRPKFMIVLMLYAVLY